MHMAAPTDTASIVSTAIDFEVPRGACDCHVHVFDPAQFPYDSGRVYTPPEALVDKLRDLQTALHFDRLVIVAPSVYGVDNSCTLDAVRQLGGAARAVVMVDNSVTTGAFDDMATAGVRGIRLNLETTADTDIDKAKRALDAIAKRLPRHDWHIQFDTRLSVISALKDDIAGLPFPVVFSHFGRAQAALGLSQPGFDHLLGLVRSGKAYVKISASYRISDKSPNFPDGAPLAQALVSANADRVLWGSNWPHPGRGPTATAIAPPYPNADCHVLNLLPRWVPNSAIRKKILVDNPARLYGFAAA